MFKYFFDLKSIIQGKKQFGRVALILVKIRLSSSLALQTRTNFGTVPTRLISSKLTWLVELVVGLDET